MIRLCKENGIPVFEKQFSLYDVYGADEAFVTGTFAGLIPVREIDGRPRRAIRSHTKGDWAGAGPMTARLTDLYQALCPARSDDEHCDEPITSPCGRDRATSRPP